MSNLLLQNDLERFQAAVIEALNHQVTSLRMALSASDASLNEYIEKTKLAEAELRAARELYAKESVRTEVERILVELPTKESK